jgi:hypothetical protein
LTRQKNNRDRKAIRENAGKEFKTQKGKGTRKISCPSSLIGHMLVETL